MQAIILIVLEGARLICFGIALYQKSYNLQYMTEKVKFTIFFLLMFSMTDLNFTQSLYNLEKPLFKLYAVLSDSKAAEFQNNFEYAWGQKRVDFLKTIFIILSPVCGRGYCVILVHGENCIIFKN